MKNAEDSLAVSESWRRPNPIATGADAIAAIVQPPPGTFSLRPDCSANPAIRYAPENASIVSTIGAMFTTVAAFWAAGRLEVNEAKKFASSAVFSTLSSPPPPRMLPLNA